MTSYSPREGAGRVSRTASVEARFSEAMRAPSFTGETVKVSTRGKKVPVRLSYRVADHTLVIDPLDKLSGDHTYRVTIKRGASDLAGHHLRNMVTWKFTTA